MKKQLSLCDKLAAKARKMAQKSNGKLEHKNQLSDTVKMAYAYEEILGEYLHKTICYIKRGKLDPKNRTTPMFKQAALLANQNKADYTDWVRAQFYWIHKWFGRKCLPFELRGTSGRFPANERYRVWKQMVRKGEISPTTSSIVLEAPILYPEEKHKANMKRLQKLMKIHDCSEQQILDTFENEGIFDLDWLRGYQSGKNVFENR